MDITFSPRLIKEISRLKADEQRFLTEYLTNGENVTKAHKAVWPGRKNPDNLGLRKLKRPDLKRILEIFREECGKAAAVDLVTHIDTLKQLRDEALSGKLTTALATYNCKHCKQENKVKATVRLPNMNAAVKAEELIGRASGLHVERRMDMAGENLNAQFLAKELAQDTDDAVREVLEKLIDGEPMDAQRMLAIAQRHMKEAA